MAELKDSFRHEILGVDLEDRVQVDLTAYDPNTTRAFIGIGFEAGQVLLEANPRIPTLILTLDQSLSPGPAQENILSLGPNIPFEAEWNIVSRLFPEQTQWILISANEIQRQKENEWAQKNINLKTFGPNPSQLEEELAHTDKNPPIVWLQRLNPIDRVQMLELGALGPFITLSGPPLGVLPNPVPESLAETPIETQEEILSSEEFNGDNPPIPPLIEIKISPQLLARQGALLLRQILKDPQTSPSLDAYLAKTLEVEIHVRKALAMEKEELIHQIKENGRKAGLKVNLVP
jgi:hypothetical protein